MTSMLNLKLQYTEDGLVNSMINGPSMRHLGSTPTIFLDEKYAINVCARKCTDMEGITDSISQAVLRALEAYTSNSRLVATLTTRCKLTLMWVPGHTGIEEKLKKWIEIRKKIQFENLPQNSLVRRFLTYSSKKTKQVLALTKSELKPISGTLTGHCD
jgi:hypothetical protein